MRERPCHARTPSFACRSGSPRPLRPLSGRFVEGPLHCVMFCHVPHAVAEALRFRSCISFLPRAPFRSVPSAPRRPGRPRAAGQFLRAYPACAPVPARARLAPARFAHLIARARRRAQVPSASGAVRGRTPAMCHVLSCSPCRRRSYAVPFLHIVPPSRSVPLRSVRAAAGLSACKRAGQFLRAYPACAPVPARARLAPARFAHLIARARRRSARLPFVPAGAFFGPSHCFSLQKRERRPREPPSLYLHSTTVSLQSSPLAEEI